MEELLNFFLNGCSFGSASTAFATSLSEDYGISCIENLRAVIDSDSMFLKSAGFKIGQRITIKAQLTKKFTKPLSDLSPREVVDLLLSFYYISLTETAAKYAITGHQLAVCDVTELFPTGSSDVHSTKLKALANHVEIWKTVGVERSRLTAFIPAAAVVADSIHDSDFDQSVNNPESGNTSLAVPTLAQTATGKASEMIKSSASQNQKDTPTVVEKTEHEAMETSRAGRRHKKVSYRDLHSTGLPLQDQHNANSTTDTTRYNLHAKRQRIGEIAKGVIGQRGSGVNVLYHVVTQDDDDGDDSSQLDMDYNAHRQHRLVTVASKDSHKQIRSVLPKTIRKATPDNMALHLKRLNHSDRAVVSESIIWFIKLFYYTEHPPVQEIITCGAAEKLLAIVRDCDIYKLVGQALICLNYLVHRADDQQINTLIQWGLIPVLLARLHCTDDFVRIETFWMVCNLSTDENYRHKLLRNGVVTAIREGQSRSQSSLTPPSELVQRMTMKAIRFLFLTQCSANLAYMTYVWPMLREVLTSSSDERTVYYAAIALKYIVHEEDDDVAAVVFKQGLAKIVLSLLAAPSLRVQRAALTIIEHLAVAGSVGDILMLVEQTGFGLLDKLLHTVHNSNKNHQLLSACRTVVGLCGGDAETIDYLVDRQILPALCDLYERYPNGEIFEQVVYAICFVVHGCDPSDLPKLITVDTVRLLVAGFAYLCDADNALVEMLTALYKILDRCETLGAFDHMMRLIMDAGGWKCVDKLREHGSDKVLTAARRIDLQAMRAGMNE